MFRRAFHLNPPSPLCLLLFNSDDGFVASEGCGLEGGIGGGGGREFMDVTALLVASLQGQEPMVRLLMEIGRASCRARV